MDEFMRRKFDQRDMNFRDELDEVLEEYEEQKYLEKGQDDGPGPDDTIH
jgi:hypothetical protein